MRVGAGTSGVVDGSGGIDGTCDGSGCCAETPAGPQSQKTIPRATRCDATSFSHLDMARFAPRTSWNSGRDTTLESQTKVRGCWRLPTSQRCRHCGGVRVPESPRASSPQGHRGRHAANRTIGKCRQGGSGCRAGYAFAVGTRRPDRLFKDSLLLQVDTHPAGRDRLARGNVPQVLAHGGYLLRRLPREEIVIVGASRDQRRQYNDRNDSLVHP